MRGGSDMILLKSAGALIAIILIPVCGWVAVVGLVLGVTIWLGAILSIIGGIVIGMVVAYLIRRWWFKWRQLWPDPYKVDKKPRWELGTRLVKPSGPYRYACAGEDLKKGTMVEADLAGRIAPPPAAELIWGNVKACKGIDPKGINVLGWPQVNVKKGRCCWLREPPLGAEFKKEGS